MCNFFYYSRENFLRVFCGWEEDDFDQLRL